MKIRGKKNKTSKEVLLLMFLERFKKRLNYSLIISIAMMCVFDHDILDKK